MHIAAGLGSCEAMEALSHGTAESDLPRRWAGFGMEMNDSLEISRDWVQ